MDDETVVAFPGSKDCTVGDGFTFDPDDILQAAKGDFLQVVVIGFDKDGEIRIRASHGSRETLWIIRRGAHHLLFETE
jgi:hypothetical protein